MNVINRIFVTVKKHIRRINRARKRAVKLSGWNMIGWEIVLYRKIVMAVICFAASVPMVFAFMGMMIFFN